jgi:hypothetical protein
VDETVTKPEDLNPRTPRGMRPLHLVAVIIPLYADNVNMQNQKKSKKSKKFTKNPYVKLLSHSHNDSFLVRTFKKIHVCIWFAPYGLTNRIQILIAQLNKISLRTSHDQKQKDIIVISHQKTLSAKKTKSSQVMQTIK